jgi:pyridoxine kinase
MPTVLALSSHVVRGHVGLSAIVPVLQRMGHDVWPMPTIMLSNHPGHKRAIATFLPVNTLEGIVDALDANGWLGSVDAVMAGYMPTVAHVTVAAAAIARVRERKPHLMVLVDPIMGDDPKGLYVDPKAAVAIRDVLVPLATVIMPNRFELAWLAGVPVTSPAEAVAAARLLAPGRVIATSIPDGDAHLANVSVSKGDATICSVKRIAGVPHGTGDMLSALYLGHLLWGADEATALGRAVAGVAYAIAASRGDEELRLIAALDSAIAATPLSAPVLAPMV